MREVPMTRAVGRRIVGGVALAGALAGASTIVAYALLRPRLRRWGATDDEAAAPLPGDERVARADYVTTHAVTIHARPADIWPWLAQMGYRRGGLYSYDWLDRLFGYLDQPSAEQVLPQFQHIEAGDTIPVGRGPAWPVVEVDAERALVLEPVAGMVTWSFALVPLDASTTRLVTRVRLRQERTLASRLTLLALDPAALVMTRKMLLGVRRRAESLARTRVRAGIEPANAELSGFS
jgi:hypothetical protein